MSNSFPKKALVLAAGFGSRLAPLTRQLPKPLVPIWGVPAIARTIDQLARWGVREVLINVHHGADAILAWARGFQRPGVHITLSFEPEICGTGGPLRRNSWFFGDDPFWIFNADVVADLSPQPLLKALASHPNNIAALWMLPDRGPRTVSVNRGLVLDFSAPNPGDEGTFTFSGLHLVRPSLLDYVSESTFSSIIDAYRCAMKDGWGVGAVPIATSHWHDLGTPEQVLTAHEATAALYAPEAVRISDSARAQPVTSEGAGRGFVSVGAHVRASKNTVLDNVVLGDGVRVMAGARVENAIVAPGAMVRGDVKRLAMSLGEAVDSHMLARLQHDGWTRHALAVFPAPRGSDRQFFRLREGARRAFAVLHGIARPENNHYAALAKRLGRLGVRVPRVLAEWPEVGLTLWEDLGDVDLLSTVRDASPRGREKNYRAALATTAAFHLAASTLTGDTQMQPGFDTALYAWEHDLFMRHLAQPLGGLSGKAGQRVLAELALCAEHVAAGPQGVVHRDLQSTNLMRHRGEWVLIDFQGMRTGAVLYDLASLLADPYVRLDFSTQLRLLRQYPAVPDAHVKDWVEQYPSACVQRLVQALGAYGRLSALPGTARFADHIQPALLQLQAALSAVTVPMPALQKFVHSMVGV